MTVADLVHNTRIDRAIGLRELAREVGCGATMICDVEHGRRRPGPGLAVRIADRLGLEGDARTALVEGAGRVGPHQWAATLARPTVVRLLLAICELAIDDRRVDGMRIALKRAERRRRARAVQGMGTDDRDR